MKRLLRLLTSLSFATQLLYASVGFSQPAILIAPEIERVPERPLITTPPIPKPAGVGRIPIPKPVPDLNIIRRPPFSVPITDGIKFGCPFSCGPNYCVLCTKAFKQLEAGWCWNAVSQIVLDYHDIKVSQCDIANSVYPQRSPCCLVDGRPYIQPSDPMGNPIGPPDCGLRNGGFPQYALDANLFDYSPPTPPNGTPQIQLLFWAAAIEQIQTDRPYIVWLDSLIGNPSHTLVVHGFSALMGGARELKVIDPQPNPPDDWFQPWDSTLRSVGSAQVPVGLGDMNNQHTGDISDIEP